jgi:uncharacterized protein (DUF1330 family)
MAKGYWIAHVDVADLEGYKTYMAANAEPFRRYGAKFLTRGGPNEVVEGKLRSRHVIIEFKDYATALACYHSPEYQKAKALRQPHSTADFVLLEGYDGPQPTD